MFSEVRPRLLGTTTGPSTCSADLERSLIKRLRFGIGTLGTVQRRQVVEAGCNVGMVWPKHVLPDRQRPLVERLCLGVATLGTAQFRQVVEARCNVGML